MSCCVFDSLSCCFKNDFYGVSGNLSNPLQIWNCGTYRGSLTRITKDCSIYGAFVPPTSVGVTDGYEHWSITGFLSAQVNCDSTIFSDVGVDWIARETFVIMFMIKNNLKTKRLFSIFVSQSGCNC